MNYNISFCGDRYMRPYTIQKSPILFTKTNQNLEAVARLRCAIYSPEPEHSMYFSLLMGRLDCIHLPSILESNEKVTENTFYPPPLLRPIPIRRKRGESVY